MADVLVKGPNNTLIRYVDQLDGTHAEQIAIVGGGGGAGLVDGDYGDVTVGGTGTTMTIDNGAVTLAKMTNIATDTVIGRDTAGTGVPEALSMTTLRTMLGIGTGGSTGLPYAQSGTRVTITAGAGVAEQVASIALPVLGPHAIVKISYKTVKSGTAGTHTINWKLGGTTVHGGAGTSPGATTIFVEGLITIQNKGAANAQIGISATLTGPAGSTLAAKDDLAANTAVAGVLLTCELTRANAADTVSLAGYTVEIWDESAAPASGSGTGYGTAYVATARAASMALSTATSTHHRVPTLTIGDTFIDPTPLVDGMEGSIKIQGGVDASWGGRWSFGAAGAPDVSTLLTTEAITVVWKYDALADGGAGRIEASYGQAHLW
jgi:hypothetical protein